MDYSAILYNSEDLSQIGNQLNVVIVLLSALVAKEAFDMVYRMILKYAK